MEKPQPRRGFDLVLKELISLHDDAKSKGSDRSGFDRVLMELMAEREKAAVASQRLNQQNEMQLMLARQQNDFQMRMLKQQEEYQARQDQLLARQDRERGMFVSKIFDVVNQQKEELSFFRTGGSGGGKDFASTPYSGPQRDLSQDWASSPGDQEIKSDDVSKLLTQQEEMVRLLKRQEEEINKLRAANGIGGSSDSGGGGGNSGDYLEGASNRAPDSQLKEEPKPMTSRPKADIPEFDSLHEIEASHDGISDLEVSSELELAVNEYEVSNRQSVMTGPPLINVNKGEKKNDTLSTQGPQQDEKSALVATSFREDKDSPTSKKTTEEELVDISEELY